jgi:hypothetical protein
LLSPEGAKRSGTLFIAGEIFLNWRVERPDAGFTRIGTKQGWFCRDEHLCKGDEWLSGFGFHPNKDGFAGGLRN